MFVEMQNLAHTPLTALCSVLVLYLPLCKNHLPGNWGGKMVVVVTLTDLIPKMISVAILTRM
jgi:hypothetical protein